MLDTDFIECDECETPATGIALDLGGRSYHVCRQCGHRIFFDYSDLPGENFTALGD